MPGPHRLSGLCRDSSSPRFLAATGSSTGADPRAALGAGRAAYVLRVFRSAGSLEPPTMLSMGPPWATTGETVAAATIKCRSLIVGDVCVLHGLPKRRSQSQTSNFGLARRQRAVIYIYIHNVFNGQMANSASGKRMTGKPRTTITVQVSKETAGYRPRRTTLISSRVMTNAHGIVD